MALDSNLAPIVGQQIIAIPRSRVYRMGEPLPSGDAQ